MDRISHDITALFKKETKFIVSAVEKGDRDHYLEICNKEVLYKRLAQYFEEKSISALEVCEVSEYTPRFRKFKTIELNKMYNDYKRSLKTEE
jgi:hypothetical protein